MLNKEIQKIIRESTFEKKKKKPGLLELIGLRTTGSWLKEEMPVVTREIMPEQ